MLWDQSHICNMSWYSWVIYHLVWDKWCSRKYSISSMSFKESKRTFLTPELSQDIYLFHLSSTLWQMKQHKKNEAHILAGSTPSPPCPLSKLRGRFWLLSGVMTFFLLHVPSICGQMKHIKKMNLIIFQEALCLFQVL